ncbi:MAG: outer membrane protein assembly factor BamD [Planctomycetota bacterium]
MFRTRCNFLSATALAAMSLLCAAPLAHAQSREYTLGSEGGTARNWTGASPQVEGPDAMVIDARRALADDDPAAARRLLDEYIKNNDRRDNPRLAEALLLRGDALVALDFEYKALYDYERVAKEFPQTEEFKIAIERELRIGLEYLGGLKRRVFGIRFADGEEIGIELLIRVQERLPGDEIAEEAAIKLADHYYGKRELRLARDAYELYLANYPEGPNRVHAERRLIDANVARFKGPEYDGGGLIDARVRIRSFARRYPVEAERNGLNEGMIARIDESLAAQLLVAAEWYEVKDDPAAERYTLERLVDRYPRTLSAARAMDLLVAKGWWDEDDAAARTAEPDTVIIGPTDAEVVTPEDGPAEDDR